MNGQTVTKAFVPLPAGATAVYTGSTLAWYRHPDWLGSSRLASTPGGGLAYDGAYAPFGETVAETGTSDRSFTGQNQDLTADLYDFPYREYNPLHGRWISPDPAGAAAADPASPQSWNRYAYVNGSPLNSVDPSGLGKCMLWDACAEAILHSEENTETGVYGSAVLLGTMLGVPATLWSPTSSTPSASPAPAGADQEAILVTFVNSDGSVLGLDSTTWLNPPGIGPVEMMLFVSSGGASWVHIAGVRSSSGAANNGTGCGAKQAVSFIHTNQAAAATVAQQLKVPTQNVLGLSGIESNWGQSNAALQANNFFGLHGGANAPFATGVWYTSGGVAMSSFPSYLASGQSFAAQFGSFVNGVSNPTAFAQALVKAGFNPGTVAGGGNPNFVTSTAATINATAGRMQCP